MKKCASCSKDLPEAALHCVFCGAKQAMAPAAPSPHAKTSFGYSANDVMQQLGNPSPSYQQQQPQARANRPSQAPGYTPPSSGLASPANPADAATVLVPASGGAAGNFNAQQAYAATDYGGTPSPFAGNASPPAPSYGNPAPGYGNPPTAPSHASTLPAPSYGNPAPAPSYGNPSPGYGAPSSAPAYGNPSPGYGNPSPGYGAPSPLGSGPMGGGMGGGMGIHAQHQQTTPAGVPIASPPYLASQTAARAGRPIEPWKDALKFMMLVWGAVALATFATPAHVDPMGFMWDVILHGQGKQKLVPLIWASVGIVSIVCAVVPLDSLPRGIVAAVLGLAGIVVPIVTAEHMPPWELLVPMLGMLALIPGLLLRHEYVESLVPRIMVTVGVVCVLVPYLIPQHSQIPLVGIFKGLIELPGEAKILPLVEVVKIVLVVVTLLVWMPGPATAGGKILAWVLLVYAVVEAMLPILLEGHIDLIVKKAPIALVMWAPALVYSVLWSYGSATIIGKQLE